MRVLRATTLAEMPSLDLPLRPQPRLHTTIFRPRVDQRPAWLRRTTGLRRVLSNALAYSAAGVSLLAGWGFAHSNERR